MTAQHRLRWAWIRFHNQLRWTQLRASLWTQVQYMRLRHFRWKMHQRLFRRSWPRRHNFWQRMRQEWRARHWGMIEEVRFTQRLRNHPPPLPGPRLQSRRLMGTALGAAIALERTLIWKNR